MLKSGIRDNANRGSAGGFLKDRLTDGSELRVVSAYFSIYAYDSLSEELQRSQKIKFLFGEPHYAAQDLGKEQSHFTIGLADQAMSLELNLRNRAVAQECAQWIEQKVDIKSIKNRLVHGKLYHIDDQRRDYAMLGSSNFTLNGLGVRSDGNLELNIIVDSDRDRDDLKAWFEEIWNDEDSVQDVKQLVLSELKKLYTDNSPEFVYFKTLSEVFENVDGDSDVLQNFEESAVTNSRIWNKLFDFQKDGVKAAVQKLDRFGGCIVADSVGLGKTYTALAVIRYFELKNKSVLVLCPKKLRENWTVYLAQNNSELNPFVADRFRYTVLSHTDLSREKGTVGDVDLSLLNWGNYDLVVVDESHNFRNNAKGKRDEEGNIVTKSRYERLMADIIQAGGKTQVLLLSATPVNNDLKDIRNQIYFITENSDYAFSDSLGIQSLKDLLSTAQKTFSEWAKKPSDRNVTSLMERLPSGLFKLLDGLSIARSRRHIEKYYQASLAQIGTFPKRLRPKSVFATIDTEDQFLSYDSLNDQISSYQLAVFNPARFLKPEFAHHYDDKIVRNFTQADRETFLIGMMKVNFLKRLESSIHSFAITMQRTIGRIEELENKLRDYQAAHSSTEIDMEYLQGTFDFVEDEDPTPAEVGGTKRFRLEHLKIDEWLDELRRDRQNLHGLRLQANDVTPDRDSKLQRLKELIAQKVENPSKNKDGELIRKVIVFTAFADTAAYLYEHISVWAKKQYGLEAALVTGGSSSCKSTFGAARFNDILVNFAPRAKDRSMMHSMPQNSEIDILIATDCISEGQNLQDCDYLVNYDIHWNPVRIIQRFGRIDRIGSRNETIQLVNFWPTEDLNKYINLKGRVEARMALVDLSATNEDNILDVDGIEGLVNDDMKYRDRQLLRLRDEVVDLEDFSESLVLSDFTLEDFRRELSNFQKIGKTQLDTTPIGIFAMVPPHPEYKSIKPGVIYCLRDKENRPGVDAVNPLQPFYLVYVKDSGEVAYGFAQARQILDIYRALCLGQTTPYKQLCALFDAETEHGQKLDQYLFLLRRTIESIASQFGKRNIGNLLANRSGKLAIEPEVDTVDTDFELITWLIVKEGEDFRNV